MKRKILVMIISGVLGLNINSVSATSLESVKNTPVVHHKKIKLPSEVEFANTIELKDYAKIKEWLEHKIISTSFEGSRIGKGLHIAVWNNDIDMINLFLKYGASVNQKNKAGETPLSIAAFKGHKNLVEYLISKGAKVNLNEPNWSPLHYAAFNGHNDLVNLLLDKYNADINASSPNGVTPLMASVYENKDSTARLLLKKGADKNLINDRGDSAFSWAMRKDNLLLAKDLTTDEDFQMVLQRPKNSWKPLNSSLIPSEQLNKLLTLKTSLEKKGITGNKLTEVQTKIDAEKHRLIDKLFNKIVNNDKKFQLHIISTRKNTSEIIKLEY